MQTAQFMNNAAKSQRVRRSEKLTAQEHRDFKKHANSFDTKVDASEYYGFSLITLDAVLLKGSGKPATVQTIRQKLAESKAA